LQNSKTLKTLKTLKARLSSFPGFAGKLSRQTIKVKGETKEYRGTSEIILSIADQRGIAGNK
jgi:DNA/RNA endonuclease YhcR with UshA esterase domain